MSKRKRTEGAVPALERKLQHFTERREEARRNVEGLRKALGEAKQERLALLFRADHGDEVAIVERDRLTAQARELEQGIDDGVQLLAGYGAEATRLEAELQQAQVAVVRAANRERDETRRGLVSEMATVTANLRRLFNAAQEVAIEQQQDADRVGLPAVEASAYGRLDYLRYRLALEVADVLPHGMTMTVPTTFRSIGLVELEDQRIAGRLMPAPQTVPDRDAAIDDLEDSGLLPWGPDDEAHLRRTPARA